jgi:hypothetical protein
VVYADDVELLREGLLGPLRVKQTSVILRKLLQRRIAFLKELIVKFGECFLQFSSVQNLLPCQLLSTDAETEIQKSAILLVDM